MNRIIRCAFAALTLLACAGAAGAADLPSRAAPPPVLAPIVEDGFQPFQIRLDAAGIITDRGGSLSTVSTGAFVSNGITGSNAIIPELDISYFFTKNLAVQLMCCFSAHNLFLNGGALAGTQVAHTWIFPPTLLFQYHVTSFGRFQPYIGVGVNYTHYFSQNPNYAVLNYVHVADSWGVAGQIGFDYMINDNWGFNVDVKKIMMNPHVDANLAGSGTALTGRADLSPWIVAAGVTYRFGGPAATPVVARY